MKILKKHSIVSAFAISSFFLIGVTAVPSAYAATSNVGFDPSSGTLSVSGNCSAKFVLVVIRRSSDNSIWGSSDPACVNGLYSYSIVVPSADRNGSNFIVAAMDGTSADQSMASMKASGSNATANVTFSAPVLTTAIETDTITLDTSSLAVDPDDTSFLDGILQNCFGIVTSALDSAEASVVAAIHLFAKIFTIIPGGSINVPSGQNQISGQGLLEAGATDVFIANTAVTSSSEIIVTPTSATQDPLAVVQINDGNGFEVGAIGPQQIPVSFTWLIVGTYVANSSTQAQSQVFVPLPPLPTTASTSVSSSSLDDIDNSSDTTVTVSSSTENDGTDDVVDVSATSSTISLPATDTTDTIVTDGADVTNSTTTTTEASTTQATTE